VAPEGVVGVHRHPVTQPGEIREGEHGDGEVADPRDTVPEPRPEPAEGGSSDRRGVFVGGLGRFAARRRHYTYLCACGGGMRPC
jgi:hypothetical protein